MTTIFRLVSRSTRSSAGSRCFISTSTRRLADPWPLPGSPEHLASTETPSDEARIKPSERANESTETLRARLVYQSRKRGTLESDLLLATFARDNLKAMSEDALKQYDKLRVHARNEGKVMRRMPSL
ncbi:MAG: mitochondrial protein [Lentinula lateritia]|nr:MAG: mitochondrial protein [Lentinula lateritia]